MIGLTIKDQRGSIYNYSMESFSDIRVLTEKYISDLSTDFFRRTQANGKMNFGMRRTKRMKALMNWVHDVYRISGYPTSIDLNRVLI